MRKSPDDKKVSLWNKKKSPEKKHFVAKYELQWKNYLNTSMKINIRTYQWAQTFKNRFKTRRILLWFI